MLTSPAGENDDRSVFDGVFSTGCEPDDETQRRASFQTDPHPLRSKEDHSLERVVLKESDVLSSQSKLRVSLVEQRRCHKLSHWKPEQKGQDNDVGQN